MNAWRITKGADYQLPLLHLMARLGSAHAVVVVRAFERDYSASIPDRHRGTTKATGKIIWEHDVHWARNGLVRVGLMGSGGHGVWTITKAGETWLAEHPEATPGDLSAFVKELSLTGVRRASSQSPRGPGRAQPVPSSPFVPDIDLEKLEQTRKLMPPDEFRRLWGPLYDQLLARERAKAITEITQAEIGRRALQRLNQIHAFLQGKNAASPSGEMVCDWIHFCYALDLCREAPALLAYVHEDGVDAAIYRRVKRIAEACRSKAGA